MNVLSSQEATQRNSLGKITAEKETSKSHTLTIKEPGVTVLAPVTQSPPHQPTKHVIGFPGLTQESRQNSGSLLCSAGGRPSLRCLSVPRTVSDETETSADKLEKGTLRAAGEQVTRLWLEGTIHP